MRQNFYYKNAAAILENATVTTKCDVYYKPRPQKLRFLDRASNLKLSKYDFETEGLF